jgi:hypothetical protein
LRYFLKKRDWGSLYKILEEIEEDMGSTKAIPTGWASHRSIDRFTRTANNRLVLGDAAAASSGR